MGLGGGEIVRSYYQSEFRHYDRERKVEIVSGKVNNNVNHLPITVVRSLPPSYPHIYDFDKISDSSGKPRRRGSGGGGGGGGGWGMCFSDPEMKRRKRVAKYKSYSAQGKLKTELQKGWKWVKNKCHKMSLFMD